MILVQYNYTKQQRYYLSGINQNGGETTGLHTIISVKYYPNTKIKR